MNKVKFTSVFGQHIERYVELRRSFGLRFIDQVSMLKLFDRYVRDLDYTGPLTQDMAIGFATSNSDNSADTCARHYSAVRYFSNFLSTIVPETPILDPKALCAHRTYPPAYIYNEEELVKLLDLAKCISATNPLRGASLHAMVAMGVGTGMRISEVVNLDRDDVDLISGIVRIRCTKFFKERLVPVHSSLLDVLRDTPVSETLPIVKFNVRLSSCIYREVDSPQARFVSVSVSLPSVRTSVQIPEPGRLFTAFATRSR